MYGLMPDEMKLPGVGKVDKKYVFAGVGVAILVAIAVYMRSRNAATAAAATDTTASPDTTDTSGIDPATGVPYADESGGGYGGVASGDYGYGTTDSTGYDAAGYPVGSQADLTWQSEQTSGVTTNSEWVQAAENGAIPGSSSTIQAALSGVLGGLTVTTAQKDLFLEAVGVLGAPPGGYPTPIKTSDTSGQSTTTTQVKVPVTVGGTAGTAHNKLVAAKLTPIADPNQEAAWIVTSTSPSAGTSVAENTRVLITAKAPAVKKK